MDATDGNDSAHGDDVAIDLSTTVEPGQPPVPGAQWDELHERWERWDDEAGTWMVVNADGTATTPRSAAEAIPVFLSRELHHAGELEAAAPHVIDVDRVAPPPQPVPGAQWNEVAGRWERWDEVAGEWVEARTGVTST